VVNAAPNSRIREVFEPAIRLMATGIIDLEPLVTHVVPLEEAADLMRRVTGGQKPDYIKGVVRL
jgi:threonine dehydrogenase-like Zn-dependent dehydrogenase